MKRGVALAGLAVATVVAAGGAWFALRQEGAPVATQLPPASAAFPGIAPRLAEAARIEVKGPDTTLVLRREGSGAEAAWGIESKGMYPAKLDRVREVLAGLSELTLSEPRTANPELLERLGLEDPARPGAKSLLLTVRDGNGAAIAELVVGRRRVRVQGGVPEAVYVRRPAENQAWLAEGSLRVDADPLLWLERELLDVKRARVARVEGGGEGDGFVLARGDGSAKLALEGDDDSSRLDETKAEDLGRALEWFAFNDVRPAAELDSEPVAGGVRFTTFDGLAVELRVKRSGDKAYALASAEAAPVPEPRPEGAELRSAEQVAVERATIARRATGFAFEIASWKADTLVQGRTALVAPPPSAAPTEAPASETPAAAPEAAPDAVPGSAEPAPPGAEPPS